MDVEKFVSILVLTISDDRHEEKMALSSPQDPGELSDGIPGSNTVLSYTIQLIRVHRRRVHVMVDQAACGRSASLIGPACVSLCVSFLFSNRGRDSMVTERHGILSVSQFCLRYHFKWAEHPA